MAVGPRSRPNGWLVSGLAGVCLAVLACTPTGELPEEPDPPVALEGGLRFGLDPRGLAGYDSARW